LYRITSGGRSNRIPEKEGVSKLRDELSKQRRELPWEKVEKKSHSTA